MSAFGIQASLRCVTVLLGTFVSAFPILGAESNPRPAIPKTWSEAELADWATPLAGINVRPAHMPSAEYYGLPEDNLKTWPVYLSGKEPSGYWEMLQRVGPKPMIEPDKLGTDVEWIEAGRTVFAQMDHLHLRTADPTLIEMVRRGDYLVPLPDGTAANVRWVPTANGVALGFLNCAGCHRSITPDGRVIDGAPSFALPARRTGPPGPAIVSRAHQLQHYLDGAAPVHMPPGPFGLWVYSAYGVPWLNDDVQTRLKDMTQAEFGTLLAVGLRGGAIPRWNGSVYYPTKVPDLIGIKDRKYIDHTGTHRNRGISDLMRYAALVSTAEATKFGPYEMSLPGSELPKVRRSDATLYALAMYIESLKPPANPNPFDEKARNGQKLFTREGCIGCHVPPLYTSNKLTVAKGFTIPKDHPNLSDVLPISVETDPGLALKTRKGTGYYKVPSLKGVWYRGHYLHDGSAASLEEMFDPDRLKDSHVPGGYNPPGLTTRAIPGHRFGLNLNEEERSRYSLSFELFDMTGEQSSAQCKSERWFGIATLV
jgi:hypothetical protein